MPASSKKLRKTAKKWRIVEWRAGQEASIGCLMKDASEMPTGGKQVLEMRKPAHPRNDWRLIEAVVDSGAEESVADPKDIPGELMPSAMSRAGKSHVAASSTKIPNWGQKAVQFMTDEGHTCGIPFQCANVAKPLIAATQLAEAGNEVVLRKRDRVIKNLTTKREVKLHRRGGVYILRMWVEANSHTGFIRQGA